MREWLGRKAFYGSSAAPLSIRHPDKTAPVVISAWSLLVWLLMAFGSASGYIASLVFAGVTTRRTAKAMKNTDAGIFDVVVLALRGIGAAALQLSAAVCRHYWPLALVAALLSRRCRQAILVAAVLDGVQDWITRNRNNDDVEGKPIGLFAYLLLKRLDDLAYGAGLWTGVIRERTLRPLKPQIKT
jgi:hypothetical protein